jgi:hypothetical protein
MLQPIRAEYWYTVCFQSALQLMHHRVSHILCALSNLKHWDNLRFRFAHRPHPQRYALKWTDEFLYFYTTYGVRQILNVNNGTFLLACMLHRLGIEFKISVTFWA